MWKQVETIRKNRKKKRMLKAPSKRTKMKGGRYSRDGNNVV